MANIDGDANQGLRLTLRKLEVSDLAEPEKWNPNLEVLVSNDAHLAAIKLSLTGGEMTGPVTFANAQPVRGRSSSGALRNLVAVTSANLARVGDAQLELRLESSVNPRALIGSTLRTLLHDGNHGSSRESVHGVPSGYYLARSSRPDQLPAWADVQDAPATATRWPAWAEVNEKPSAFPPAAHAIGAHSDTTGFTPAGGGSGDNGTATSIARGDHRHDGRYYTRAQIDTMLSGMPVAGHNHDTRYHQRSEITDLLSGKANSGHDHDARYVRFDTGSQGLTSGQQTNARANIGAPATDHDHHASYVRHDGSQGLAELAQTRARQNIDAAKTSHPHAISDVTNLQTELNGKLATSGTAANSNQLGGQAIGSFVRTNANSTVASGSTLTVAGTLNVTGTLRVPVK